MPAESAAQAPATQPSAPEAAAGLTSPAMPVHSVEVQPNKRQLRAAEDAYVAGARKLGHNDLTGADEAFAKALKLDPLNRQYALALAVEREHRVTELVQQSSRAKLTGQNARAETLLAEARSLDPNNPIVIEHSGLEPAGVQIGSAALRSMPVADLADRSRMLAGDDAARGRSASPPLAGAVRLSPANTLRQFHLQGDSRDLIRQVASAYGITATFDDSVEHKNLRFDLEGTSYEQAIKIITSMAEVFAVPLDAKTAFFAKDDAANRDRLQPILQETIFLPGRTIEQINDMANVIRNVFEVKQITVQTQGIQSMVLRAPEETLGPMNETLRQLDDSTGAVLLDVKLYAIDTTRTRSIGATLPASAGIYSVDAAATNLVNSNQALVQQAISQGYVAANASNIDIALALIASGLVQSSLLSSTVGFFGHGLTLMGVTAATNTTFNLALNSSDTRTIDDVQTRVNDRQMSTFRSGTRYPITTSKYTTGLSTLPAGAASATINGVSVASLLQQYAGGSSTTIPQVSYEDLGVTLKTTPTMEKSGRISLQMDLKIEALSGNSLNGIPVLQSRAVTTTITVADGESALLVSNLSGTESAAVSGLPGLSELPGFQAPADKNTEKDSSQLVLMVTPRVVRRRSNMLASPQIVVRAQEPQ